MQHIQNTVYPIAGIPRSADRAARRITDKSPQTLPASQPGGACSELPFPWRARTAAGAAPRSEAFEIVAGASRYRAARIAAVQTVPARVREMTDAEALEVQCIENLQREDIHPLEEAQGFRAPLDLSDQQYTTARIGERAGKSAAYIAGRLKLTELIPDVADAFLVDRITLGHALLIAKLPAVQQQEAFKAAFKSTWTSSGQTEILVPVRELTAWIDSNLLLDLKTAPFDRADASLVAEAGSCHECTKRTGANSLLFPEILHDACLDGACWKGKVAAHISDSVERHPQLLQISSNRRRRGRR